jgi:hypothetical protein
MTWKLLLKNKKIRIALSQRVPNELGFFVVLLSSDDFTEDRNDEKLIERFPDEPYSSIYLIFTFFCSFFYEVIHRSSSASIFLSNTSSIFLLF